MYSCVAVITQCPNFRGRYEGGECGKNEIKRYHEEVQMSYDECVHDKYLKCTNKQFRISVPIDFLSMVKTLPRMAMGGMVRTVTLPPNKDLPWWYR